jgi:hypothetical protein
MTASTNLIQHSFELAAERCEDLTPLVYRRLFRDYPDRTGHFRMIQCEVQSHDAYGTPRELFGKFFGVIADTIRELVGTDWSPEMDDGWRRLLGEIDAAIAQSDLLTEG